MRWPRCSEPARRASPPGAFALQTAVPVLLAPVVTGERWSRPAEVLFALALVLAAALRLGVASPAGRLVDHD